eukprot:2450222-Prymnesium_polylepis.1
MRAYCPVVPASASHASVRRTIATIRWDQSVCRCLLARWNKLPHAQAHPTPVFDPSKACARALTSKNTRHDRAQMKQMRKQPWHNTQEDRLGARGTQDPAHPIGRPVTRSGKDIPCVQCRHM